MNGFLNATALADVVTDVANANGAEEVAALSELSNSNITLIAIQIIACLFLVCVIILQSGKRSGLSGAISGVADSFMSKNKAKTWDARLARMTKWVAVLFAIVTMALNLGLVPGS